MHVLLLMRAGFLRFEFLNNISMCKKEGGFLLLVKSNFKNLAPIMGR